MFTLSVLELMLFDGRSVLTPAKRLAGSDRVKSEAVRLLVRQPKGFYSRYQVPFNLWQIKPVLQFCKVRNYYAEDCVF